MYRVLQPHTESHPALISNPDGVKPKVLIVDDDPMLTRLIASIFTLEHLQFELVIAKNGSEAMDYLESLPIKAMITDLNMPGVDGTKLLGYLKDHFPQIPCAVMTGDAKTAQKFPAQVKEFIHKPFDPAELKETILTLLGLDYQLSGKITGISISNFLQIVEAEKKTGVVHIVAANGTEGRFFLKKGELLDANFGRRSGTEAALAMLLIESTSMSLHRLPIPEPKRVIQETIVNLLLLASQIADEEARSKNQENADTPPKNGVEKSISGLEDPQIQMLINPIKNLRNEFKLNGMVIVDAFNHIRYANCENPFLTEETMMQFLVILTQASNMLENEGAGLSQEVLWTTDDNVFIARKTKVMSNIQLKVLIACPPGPHKAIVRTKLKHILDQILPAIFKTQEFLAVNETKK